MPETSSHARYPAISDYGLIGDLHAAALVSRAGCIDWYCAPRFDSPPVFARLLDWERGGFFRVAPVRRAEVSRRYLGDTNVLETTFRTAEGVLRVTDFMPIHPTSRPDEPHDVFTRRRIVRIAECIEGTIDLEIECAPRFGWDFESPQLRVTREGLAHADGGEGDVFLYASVALQCDSDSLNGHASLRAGERVCTVLVQSPDERAPGDLTDDQLLEQLAETKAFWERWSAACVYDGPYREHVLRSAIVLKALSYSPTGALIAAPTTSLPERIGGERNWDYRFTWIRDAGLAVSALAPLGLHSESLYFKEWLEHWAEADEGALQVLYGPDGERDLPETTLDGVDGYRGSRPVRVGNDAYRQFQLDIYGELLHSARAAEILPEVMDEPYWDFHRRITEYVIAHWREPDAGIWETRAGRKHFVYSKAMCWLALDCAIATAVDLQLEADLERWRAARTEIRDEVLAHGFNPERGIFTQAYGSEELDASLLMLPLIGFIEATDPRMRATIAAIREQLAAGGGLLHRYRGFDDGLDGSEGAFVVCAFWLVENLVLLGEPDDARALFERVIGYANDLGLLSEEVDGESGILLGNFPQAFSHLGLISAALSLHTGRGARVPGEDAHRGTAPARTT